MLFLASRLIRTCVRRLMLHGGDDIVFCADSIFGLCRILVHSHILMTIGLASNPRGNCNTLPLHCIYPSHGPYAYYGSLRRTRTWQHLIRILLTLTGPVFLTLTKLILRARVSMIYGYSPVYFQLFETRFEVFDMRNCPPRC